jgi:hypothetical protein
MSIFIPSDDSRYFGYNFLKTLVLCAVATDSPGKGSREDTYEIVDVYHARLKFTDLCMVQLS